VLVLNVGSSTLKVALFEPGGTARLWEASTQRRGALRAQLQGWLEPQLQPWWPQIQAAGHRLVQLEALNPLAPLHNAPALEGIRWLQALQPALPQWACFDTAFHHSLPPEARTYALPAAWRRGGIRRFGFHGLNHQHVAEAAPCGRAARWRQCRTAAASTPPWASPPWRGW